MSLHDRVQQVDELVDELVGGIAVVGDGTDLLMPSGIPKLRCHIGPLVGPISLPLGLGPRPIAIYAQWMY